MKDFIKMEIISPNLFIEIITQDFKFQFTIHDKGLMLIKIIITIGFQHILVLISFAVIERTIRIVIIIVIAELIIIDQLNHELIEFIKVGRRKDQFFEHFIRFFCPLIMVTNSIFSLKRSNRVYIIHQQLTFLESISKDQGNIYPLECLFCFKIHNPSE